MRISYSDIINILGFTETLRAGYYVETIDKEEGKPKRVWVLWYWLATIPNPSPHMDENIKLAVVATDAWLKGMLLVPSLSEPKSQLAGLQPRRSVILNDRQDEVVEVLQTHNVMPLHIKSDFGKETDFDLEFGTLAGYGRLHYSTRINSDKHITNLWYALCRTMIKLSDFYNDPEIKEAIAYERLKARLNERIQNE